MSEEKPVIVQKAPYVIDVEPGNYAWCSCGLSKKPPYCDGAHKPTSFKPVIENVTEARTIYWCGCKHTANAPFCDGSHSRL